MKAIISNRTYSVVDGKVRTPILEPDSIPELGRRVYAAGGRSVILIMDDWENPAMEGGWFRITGGTDLPGLDMIITTTNAAHDARCPLLCLWPEDTSAALAGWYDATGAHWFMTPGVSGLEVLRRLLRAGKFADLKATMPDAVADFYEPPLTPGGWHSGAGGSFFTVDARRAGLAAAGVAELAPFALEYSDNRRHFEDRAGWVLIERGPWNETRMPDPVGPRSEGAVIWVTTATLNLLQELQAAGVYEIVRIYESYTAPSRRVLRKWSEIINTTYMNTYAGNPELAPPDLNAISAAAKDVGRETIGMFDSKNGASTRSDWFHTINAVKRCNIWRKAWHLGRTADIWPRFLDDDTIAYSARPYTEQFLAAFPEGEALGRWRWQQHPIG